MGTAFAMFAMVIGLQNNILLPKKQRKYFQSIFILLALVNIAELTADFVLSEKILIGVFHLAKTCELGLSPAIPLMVMRALKPEKKQTVCEILSATNIILVIASLFTGFVYRVTPDYVYYRENIYVIMVVIYLFVFICLIAECVRFCRSFQVKDIPLFLMLLLLVLTGISMSVIGGSKIRLDWTYISIAAMLFYIFFNQLCMQVDGLTGLLNRRSYDYSLERLKENAIILIFDVNNFKSINDKFGHLYGDECLRKTGENIRKVFGKNGTCYRIGGDEFCVIMTKNCHTIKKQIEKFQLQTQETIEKDKNFPTCAIGYTFFDASKGNIEEILAKADEEMYKNKRL